MNILDQAVVPLDEQSRIEAAARQDRLTKPRGALGDLESLVIDLAAMQGRTCPALDQVGLSVFAADHGVVEEGVSAYPQTVTTEMVRNFARGGAAVSVLAAQAGAAMNVVDLGAVMDPLQGMTDAEMVYPVVSRRIAPGTRNLSREPAMSIEQCDQAMQIGAESVQSHEQSSHAHSSQGLDMFIGGEMGIGNTTAATAMACALLQAPTADLVGPGTGLLTDQVQHKAQIIQRALDLHADALNSPEEMLRRLGGFEIAALVGAYLYCGTRGVPVLLDGFISGVAALAAMRIKPGVERWFIQSHASAEPGHQKVLGALGLKPLLQLGMRLGEGSGAALALPLLRSACALHTDMATFTEAGVSDKE